MSHLFKIQIVVAVAFLVSACASPSFRNHIDRAARPHLDEVDAYLVVEQDEIRAGHLKSRISGGYELGVLDQLIIAAVNNSLEEQSQSHAASISKPIRENLDGFDFAEILSDELNATLGEIDWLNAKDLVLLRTLEKDLFLSKCESSRASATLFVGAQYLLSPDLSHVMARVESIMFPNVEALEIYKARMDQNENPVDEADNIYQSNFIVRVPLKVEGLVKDRGNILARDGAAKVKSALTQCAVKVSDYIGRDLERDETADQKKK